MKLIHSVKKYLKDNHSRANLVVVGGYGNIKWNRRRRWISTIIIFMEKESHPVSKLAGWQYTAKTKNIIISRGEIPMHLYISRFLDIIIASVVKLPRM